jgi:hypothetical protein
MLLVLVYLAVAVGFPVPTSSHREGGEPFPCQSHAGACGCLSAEQCWAHCCCFSFEGRLAWAYASGVEPPAFVQERSAKVAADPELQQATHACHSPNDAGPPADAGNRRAAKFRLAIGPLVLGCGGQFSQWLTSVIATPPAPRVAYEPDPAVGESLVLLDQTLTSPRLAPQAPPPRR